MKDGESLACSPVGMTGIVYEGSQTHLVFENVSPDKLLK